jgi:hypothetical protein
MESGKIDYYLRKLIHKKVIVLFSNNPMFVVYSDDFKYFTIVIYKIKGTVETEYLKVFDCDVKEAITIDGSYALTMSELSNYLRINP